MELKGVEAHKCDIRCSNSIDWFTFVIKLCLEQKANQMSHSNHESKAEVKQQKHDNQTKQHNSMMCAYAG